MEATTWITLTLHTAYVLRGAGADALLLDDARAENVGGKCVVVAPSAARSEGAVRAAVRRLQTLGADVRVVETAALDGALDVADLIEQREAEERRVDLPALAEAARPLASAPITRAADNVSGLVLRRVSDVQARPVRWLWPGRIARGKVSMIAGHPGLGKSQLTLSLAAIVSTGGQWPVDHTHCERGSVLILSAEDDAEDTIRPRLEAAGADLSRVHVLDAVEVRDASGSVTRRGFSLSDDLSRLSAKLAELRDVALVVVDPVTAYLGETDSHKAADVRAVLAPLGEVAATHGAAIVAVSHRRKSGAGEALLQVTGSLAFVAAARAAYIVAKDQANPLRRLMLPVKNNLGDDQTGYAFRIDAARLEKGIETSHVTWEAERVTVTADEALAPAQVAEERSAVEDAADFLRGLLADGPVPARQVRTDAEGAGHSWAAMRRAQKAVGVEVVKAGMRGGWEWRIAPKMLKTPEDAQEGNVSTFGNVEHLREPAGAQSEAGEPDSEVF